MMISENPDCESVSNPVTPSYPDPKLEGKNFNTKIWIRVQTGFLNTNPDPNIR